MENATEMLRAIPLGGGGTPPGEAYTNSRTERVLFLQVFMLQRVRF